MASPPYSGGLAIVFSAAVFLGACASRPAVDTNPSAPSFRVNVDRNLKRSDRHLPRYPDGAVRPLATLTDKSGRITTFVENELLVELATPSELNAFLDRWQGKVLATDDPRKVGIDAEPTYLIRVQVETVDTSKLTTNLAKLNPRGASDITVSSEAARRLIAAGAEAAMAGNRVGINYLAAATGFQNEELAEAALSNEYLAANNNVPVEFWNANPFAWVYMKKGGPLDIGVAPAWSALERTGRFANKVTIAVLDGGFGGHEDFPLLFETHAASFAAHDFFGSNEVECNGTPCPWHGWNVVNALMGQVDNGIGAAGPAGPVAKLIAIRRTADVFNNIHALSLALFSHATIVNMSFSVDVPALLSWSMIPFNLATLRAQGAGTLLIASAGNGDEDINEESCFVACWEDTWWAPCENGGVLCVGAMDAAAPVRRNKSNYGGDELDIWGPGTVWVSGDYENSVPHAFGGTSAAAPFVAGVAALIWAARPSLSNEEVEGVLYATAHQGLSGQVERWPNAYAAVIRALGGTPPVITISARHAQIFGACATQFELTSTVIDPDDGPPVVTWTSDKDGLLGTGESLLRPLSNGRHHITATALDRSGLLTRAGEVILDVENSTVAPRPTVDILSLTNHQKFASNQNVTLEAGGIDVNRAGGQLVPANVRWVSSKDGELGSGQRIVRTLSAGSHYVFAYYTGVCGGTADDIRLIEITSAVRDAPPNMTITIPSDNDLVLYADDSGQACLTVNGFGYDEEDRDFATIEWWETSRSDLQWKVLSFDQKASVCLKIVTNPTPMATTHEIRLRGKDRTGHIDVSAPLRVTVLPGLR